MLLCEYYNELCVHNSFHLVRPKCSGFLFLLVLLIFRTTAFLFFCLALLKESAIFSQGMKETVNFLNLITSYSALCAQTDKRTAYVSIQTDRLCWTGFKTGSELSASDVTCVKDSVRLLLDYYSEYRGVKGHQEVRRSWAKYKPNFIVLPPLIQQAQMC